MLILREVLSRRREAGIDLAGRQFTLRKRQQTDHIIMRVKTRQEVVENSAGESMPTSSLEPLALAASRNREVAGMFIPMLSRNSFNS